MIFYKRIKKIKSTNHLYKKKANYVEDMVNNIYKSIKEEKKSIESCPYSCIDDDGDDITFHKYGYLSD